MNKELNDLIERFAENSDRYRRADYNETQVRVDFINPLFKLLGWDVYNEKGHGEQYREVIHEDAIKVAGSTKSPDYSFRIGGQRKFFLEAKKPSVNIKDDIHPAYQLRRYAWSAKLPLSILTDFEEFAVYDCRIKPNKTDKASVARIFYCKYDEFPEKWDYISSIFSADAVWKGSFDRFAESNKRKQGTAEVDDAFLQEMESWRDALARNIALRNKDINIRQLNELVQKTIDRIVFLRICEDRGIEQYGQLQKLLNVTNVYNHLCGIFERADEKYNSGLFHFKKEKDRPDYDDWTLEQTIDDKVLKEILKRLYYPDSPYEFSVLPSDILGQVYERFLGKVIRLTAGHQAKIEEKPEVRKAGGVYYTPTYIVDYIVKNTIGKKLGASSEHPPTTKEHPPTPSYKEGEVEIPPLPKRGLGGVREAQNDFPISQGGVREAQNDFPISQGGVREAQNDFPPKLTILDPACGSGSFLLGAYQFLLDWYLEQYSKEPEKYTKGKEPKIYQTRDKQYKLTIQERKRILLEHIYGVDIDSQAVEVTKLSLLLKVLEGETEESLGLKQLTLKFRERALPDLDSNIKCGNSLIGPDFYDGNNQLFDEEEMYRINTFDWHAEFPHIFGNRNSEIPHNPPLAKGEAEGRGIRNSELGNMNSEIPHNPPLAKGEAEGRGIKDSQSGFDVVIGNPPYINIENLDKKFINYFFKKFNSCQGRTDIYVVFIEKFLEFLKSNSILSFIIPFSFTNQQYATVIRKQILEHYNITEITDVSNYLVFKDANIKNIIIFLSKNDKKDTTINLFKSEPDFLNYNMDTFSTLQSNFYKLKDFRYQTKNIYSIISIKDRIMLNSIRLDKLCFIAYGARLNKKNSNIGKKFYIHDANQGNYKPFLEGKDIQRYHYKQSAWLNYCANEHYNPMFQELFENEKIMFIRIISDRIRFAYDINNFYNSHTVINCLKYETLHKVNHISPRKALKEVDIKIYEPYSLKFILGILNSNLMNFYFFNFLSDNINFYPNDAKQLPIRTIDFTIPEEKAMHDKMVELVERMLELNKRVHGSGLSTQEKKVLENQIQITDKQIDQLVYKLYDLTEEEIKIVEGGV